MRQECSTNRVVEEVDDEDDEDDGRHGNNRAPTDQSCLRDYDILWWRCVGILAKVRPHAYRPNLSTYGRVNIQTNKQTGVSEWARGMLPHTKTYSFLSRLFVFSFGGKDQKHFRLRTISCGDCDCGRGGRS
ncbi:unnamed protein product [Ceratitis capitata]|uniref:(Mediterranean fruit fly) hypothetical protein n=1 Tax=Ceratitis capitata TaxID=7213 RepID=A0A811U5F5_CERCA|nr:unnamed protein product [Ceratitis capitata]